MTSIITPRGLDIERYRMIREADAIHAPQAEINAYDDLHERLRAAALHTSGGVLLEPERPSIIHSVVRHHGLSHERMREFIDTEEF